MKNDSTYDVNALTLKEQGALKEKEKAGQVLATPQGGALAPIENPTFNLPILSDPQGSLEVIQENMEDLDREYKFEKITVPGSGGIAFTVIDENGNAVPMTKITGIILDKFSFSAWYIKSFDEKTDEDTGIPDCLSTDLVHGSGCPDVGIPENQLCASCPKGQWGSQRKGGRGKDCSNKIRVHILRENRMFPFFIDLPPSSIGKFGDHVQRLADNGFSYYAAVTTMGIETATNDAGTKYSKATFNKSASLTKEEKAAIKGFIRQLMPSMRKVTEESFQEIKPVEGSGVDSKDEDNPY